MRGITYRVFPILLFLSIPCQALIFEADDRRYVAVDDVNFRAIGLVRSSRGIGTGFLVDDCNVLTSRHIQSESEAVIGSRMTFKPHARVSVREVAGQVVASGNAPRKDGNSGPNRDRHDDWLLLKLDRCLGGELGFFSFPAGSVPVGTPLMNAGFPFDRGRKAGPSIDPSCKIHYITKIGALHDCAFSPGNSGGPLFDVAEEGGRVTLRAVAIGSAGYRHSSLFQFSADRANVATSIAPIYRRLRPFLNPVFRGTSGNDVFNGSAMTDRLIGGDGNDTFILDREGGDSLAGERGADRFKLTYQSGSHHLIEDFNPTDGDIIDISSIDADQTIAGTQPFRLAKTSEGSNAGMALLECSSAGNLLLRLYVRHRGASQLAPDYQMSLRGCPKIDAAILGIS